MKGAFLPLAMGIAAVWWSAPAPANDFKKFYTAIPQDGRIAQAIPTSEEPEIISPSGTDSQIANAMFEQGFGPVGYSSFNGPARKDSDILKQAKLVGAKYAIVARKFTGTREGVVPLTLPTSNTTTLNGMFPLIAAMGMRLAPIAGPPPPTGHRRPTFPINRTAMIKEWAISPRCKDGVSGYYRAYLAPNRPKP